MKNMSRDCFKKKSKNPVTQLSINTDFFAVFVSYKYIYIYIYYKGKPFKTVSPLRIYFIYSPVHHIQVLYSLYIFTNCMKFCVDKYYRVC